MNSNLQQEGRLAPASQLTTQTDATAPSANQQPGQAPSADFSPMIVMAVLFVFFWFVLIRPEKKRQKKIDEMRGNLAKGNHVVTAGGMHGTITRIENNFLILKVEDGSKIKFDKSAIARLSSKEAESDGVAIKS